MFDRSVQPKINLLSSIQFPLLEKEIFPNKIPLYTLVNRDFDLLRLDFIFSCGSWNQNKLLTSYFTNKMLNQGTSDFSAKNISETFDFLGSWIKLSPGQNNCSVSIYTLKKHFAKTLEIIESMLKQSIFPQKEFEVLADSFKQNLLYKNNQINVIANNKTHETLYGKNHPYGKHATADDIKKLNINDLKEFFSANYGSKNCQIFLSGNISISDIKLLEEKFGTADWGNSPKIDLKYKIEKSSQKSFFIPKKDSVQNAIILAQQTIMPSHEDYFLLSILVTAFGGYFGSRLMQNIRENKGYTYGIYAYFNNFKYSNSLHISTQANYDYTQNIFDEIRNEMDKLQNKPLSDNELRKVKSYMLGEIARSFDGTFFIIGNYIDVICNNLDVNHYTQSVEAIKNATPENLLRVAQNHLKFNDFYRIVVGKKL